MVPASELDFDGHQILAAYDKARFELSAARRSHQARVFYGFHFCRSDQDVDGASAVLSCAR
jgi:hypothetical protein